MIRIDSKHVLILVVIGMGALNGPEPARSEEADILDTLSSEQAVSVATGYEKPVNLAPAVATVITRSSEVARLSTMIRYAPFTRHSPPCAPWMPLVWSGS